MRSHRVMFSLLLSVASALLGGCAQAPEGSGVAHINPPLPPAPGRQGEPIQTDALVYTLEIQPGIVYDATAVATYTNVTNRTVYFDRCSSETSGPIYSIQRAEPDEDKPSFIGHAWACVGGVPRGEVGPGETLSAKVWLGSLESPDAQPPIRPEERVGRFRISFELFAEPGTNDDYGGELPLEERRSNAFDLRFPE